MLHAINKRQAGAMPGAVNDFSVDAHRAAMKRRLRDVVGNIGQLQPLRNSKIVPAAGSK